MRKRLGVSGFVAELRRRSVFRAAALYAGFAWFAASALDILLPLAGAPDWVMPTLLAILAVGFVVVLIGSWFLEIGIGGLRLDAGTTPPRSRTWALVLVVGLLVLSGTLLTFFFDRQGKPVAAPTDSQIVVLTFKDLSPQSGFAWLAEGLSLEIRRQIAAWNTVQVLPLALTPQSAQAVDGLEAGFMLDGFIQATDTKVVAKVELLNLESKQLLWQQEFTGNPDDPLALQERIAAEVARFFNQSVGAGVINRPNNPAAYATYLKRLHYGQTGDTEQDAYWLEKTLEIDPQWHYGRAELALVHLRRFAHSQDIAYLEKSKRELSKGELAPQHFVFDSIIEVFGDGHLDEGERRFATMVQNPWGPMAYYNYAWLMGVSGLYVEAEAAMRHIAELAPYNAEVWEHLVWLRANLGKYQEATEAAAKLEQYSPTSLGDGSFYAAISVWPFSKTFEEASDGLARFKAAVPDRDFTRAVYDFGRFNLAISQNDMEQARVVAESRIDNNRPAETAIMYLRIGEIALAEKYFALAASTARYGLWGWMYRTQLLTPELRKHPLFVQHEANMGITPQWRYELCKRAAKMPKESGISCEPSNYESTQAIGIDMP